MSDDRMDRATRIRNMREGNRGTDDDQPDDDDRSGREATDDSASAATADNDRSGREATDDSASAATAGDTSATTTDEETTTTHGTEPGSSAPADDGPAVDTRSAVDRAETATESSGSPDVPPGTDAEAGSDAMAAVQRAAASAAEVMGTETSTGTDSGTIPGEVSGVELPDRELLEAAMATSTTESTEGGARAAMGEESSQSEEVVRVLEFSLGGEYYCLDIEYVEEIVKRNAVTRVPNTPAFVDGVVDLRGQITTILEPKAMMDIESEGEQNLIIVFDPEQFEDQGAVGWVVDEVRQVVPVTESEINNPPVDADYINGVIDREGHEQFVIWVEPEDALAQATATDGE